MNRKIKDQILELRSKNKSYKEIAEILDCSRGSIAYHCGKGQKEKSKLRNRKNAKRRHPYKSKISRFLNQQSVNKKEVSSSLKKRLYEKVRGFLRSGVNMNQPFTFEDVINKFGENPKCYLTGQEIDIYDVKSYHFDHIIPVSKGGDNSLKNLGICTKNANMAKTDMTYEEFLTLCQSVVDYAKNKIDSKCRI